MTGVLGRIAIHRRLLWNSGRRVSLGYHRRQFTLRKFLGSRCIRAPGHLDREKGQRPETWTRNPCQRHRDRTVHHGPGRTDLSPTTTCGLSPSQRSHWPWCPVAPLPRTLAYHLQTKHRGRTLATVTRTSGGCHWTAHQAEKLLGTTGDGAPASLGRQIPDVPDELKRGASRITGTYDRPYAYGPAP